ncbi:UNVERIFIED_CONTAM: hypothetical protein GTU68_049854 [Idotea baltica]|nr:hypothetical protein [Idotea baltica]
MGTSEKIQVDGRKLSAPELSSLVLRSLKEDAEKDLAVPITDAVITVPAYFNDHQRKATRMAGELAGLNVRRIINEPTAAALTYGFHDRESDKKLIVIDLGGGTFDVTLMEIFEGTLEIISTAGESFLGGEDFTDRLVATVLKTMGMQIEVAELKHPKMVARLRQQCDTAKTKFTDEEFTHVRIPDDNGEISESAKRVKVTRNNFSKVAQRLMDRLKGPISRVLRDAECEPTDIEDVILVGGATRMPVLKDFIKDFLQSTPHCQFNPDEVVGLGAAIQAALIIDDAAVDDMGVETARMYGTRMMDGYYVPVIHRNTTIPVSREEVFSTMHANQQSVTIKIYQGEARKTENNIQLGELEIKDIPPGPEGQEIFVRFTYDMNGILEVEGMAGDSGTKQSIVITQNVAGLSQAEIKKAVKRMADLKFYPREDLGNTRLLLYCERVIGEVSPQQRDTLEHAISVFEHAMHTSDRDSFEHSKQGLLMTLSSLGFGYDDSNDDTNA